VEFIDVLSFHHATLDDVADVAGIIEAMDQHYVGAGNTRGLDAAMSLVHRTIDTKEGTRFLLARDGTRPVGIACFAILSPGHRLSGVLFLKDLFVPAHLRGRGIGRALMCKLAAWAQDQGIGRIDLTIDKTNEGARALYERLGGAPQDKIMFRYEGGALAALAGSAKLPD
jgi:GNAT superfamily N-acetyltransferase